MNYRRTARRLPRRCSTIATKMADDITYTTMDIRAYPLPNDESESSRLDMMHELSLVLLYRKLYLAPIKKPQRVIDLVTGPIDFGQGDWGDWSPIQPTLVPPNVKFLVDDIESEWAYEKCDLFDFIHGRNLLVSIRDFRRLIKECYLFSQAWLLG
ncbi:hypothetical protein VTN49DRAFT_2043 [Thermomyces lanuginosus]|uniref:uncharacterized protein n=1 Tax=Thermomyces lanuginosus TaxID=5541 RepID=UPI0037440A8C